MASPAAILSVVVRADTARAQAALVKTQRTLRQTASTGTATANSLHQIGRSGDHAHKGLRLVGRGAAYALGAGGFGGGLFAVFEVGQRVVQEFREAQKVGRQTNAVLKSTGAAANVTAGHVEDLAAAIASKVGIDDEAIQSGENLLLTFTKIRNEAGKGNNVFDRATKTIVDMSVAMDQDLRSSTIQVGKALQDPIRGLTALRRVGVNFNEQQSDMVKRLVESGHQLEAQRFILKELNTEFGGSAAATATTGGKLNVALGNLAESIGRGLAPSLSKAAAGLTVFVNQMQSGVGAGGRFAAIVRGVGHVVGDVVGFFKQNRAATGALVGALAAGAAAWIAFRVQATYAAVATTVATGGLNLIVPALIALAAAIGAAYAKSKTFRNVVDAVAGALKDAVVWVVRLAGRIGGALVAAFKMAERVFGNVMAAILRGFAKLFDVASHLPGIGGKFKDLADKANALADKVDRAGEKTQDLGSQIRRLHGKELDIKVNLLLNDPATKRLVPLPSGGPKLQNRMEDVATTRGRKWALAHLDEIAPLLGAPGTAPGKLGLLEQIGHQMGLVTTSGYRPGDPGWHGKNRARDLAGPPGTMLAFARRMFTQFGSHLLELIHSPMRVGIKNGSPVNILDFYGPAVYADHFDHVHVAAQRGGRIAGMGSGDKVPALLEPGEFVMNRKATATVGPLLAALNKGIPRFASGGLVARAAQAAGFRGDNLIRAVAEAGGESGWNERAVGDGGWSKGLMQIYTKVHTWARRLNLFNPFVNMRAAYRIWKSQGWGAWHGDHTPWIGRARAAVAALRAGHGGDDGARSRRHKVAATHGALTDRGIIEEGQDRRFGMRQDALSHIRDDDVVTPTEAAHAFKTYGRRAQILQGRIARMKRRLRKINKALHGKLRPATRKRLLGEKQTLLSDIGTIRADVRGLTGEYKDLVAPFDTEGAGGENDLRQQQIDATKALAEAVAGLRKEQQQTRDLVRAQGPALTSALIQMINGGIGGDAGLGRQFPSSTGLGGLSRA